jgi:hypothetical protein
MNAAPFPICFLTAVPPAVAAVLPHRATRDTYRLWLEARKAHPSDGPDDNASFLAALEHFRVAVEAQIQPKD